MFLDIQVNGGSGLLFNDIKNLDEFLKMPPGHSHEHSEKLHQIALARAIRADEDVQWPQLKIFQFPDGLETADVEFFDCSLLSHYLAPSY